MSKVTQQYLPYTPSDPSAAHVREAEVVVDAAADHGPIDRLWASIGYDEINWTYTPRGKELLGKFSALNDGAYHIRTHYVFCSGTGLSLPHWGNGNVYHEDENGRPYYDFTIVDQVYDAIVDAGHHPLVELGFTPRALVPDEASENYPYEPSPTTYSSYEAGTWAYPPKDYGKWEGLVEALARHCLQRYGKDEVSAWLWEMWNEPDIFYWRGTPEEFNELYAVTTRAIRRVLPVAAVGGPTVTGGDGGVPFMRGFLDHCYEHDLPLDFLSFHTKGGYFSPGRVYGPTAGPAPVRQSPSTAKMLREVRRQLRIIAEFPNFVGLPVVVDECDASVPAHWGAYDNANFQYRNTEYYAVFQCKLMKKLLDLNATSRAKVTQATAWTFYFEGERYFEGTRSFLTCAGVEKPVLNAYRMLAKLGGHRVGAWSTAAWQVSDVDGTGSGAPEEIDVLATRDDAGGLALLVWRHADDQYHADSDAARTTVRLRGLAAGEYVLGHWRIDADHSNAHSVWTQLGSPQDPDPEQLRHITERQGLEQLEPDRHITMTGDEVELTVELPLPSVSALVLTPAAT